MYVSRRTLFVLGLALLPGARALPAFAKEHAPRPVSDLAPAKASVDRFLAACLPTQRARNAAAQLGARCARLLPATETQLGRDAVTRAFRADVEANPSPHAVRAAIARRRDADLRAGRVLHVDGWILSDTEVQLCCIAHRARSRDARV